MSFNSRRILTAGDSRKRKEREMFYPSTSPKPLLPPTSVTRAVSGPPPPPKPNNQTTSFRQAEPHQQPLSSNRLLAGYMAYEFLSKGTLLGQKFDPNRPEPVAVNPTELKRSRSSLGEAAEPSGKPMPPSYAEVANILKSDGAHVPGVVNPTQLARWIKM